MKWWVGSVGADRMPSPDLRQGPDRVVYPGHPTNLQIWSRFVDPMRIVVRPGVAVCRSRTTRSWGCPNRMAARSSMAGLAVLGPCIIRNARTSGGNVARLSSSSFVTSNVLGDCPLSSSSSSSSSVALLFPSPYFSPLNSSNPQSSLYESRQCRQQEIFLQSTPQNPPSTLFHVRSEFPRLAIQRPLQNGVTQNPTPPKPDKPKWEEEEYANIGKSTTPIMIGTDF
jgi:hypothetical protein